MDNGSETELYIAPGIFSHSSATLTASQNVNNARMAVSPYLASF